MDLLPKTSVWKSLATGSNKSSQKSQTQRETNLPLDVWPELPGSGSLKLPSSESASRKNLPAESSIPERSEDKGEPQSTGGSPTPRAKPTYSAPLRPRSDSALSQGNDRGDHLSLESQTSQSIHAAFKPSLSAPSSNHGRVAAQMPPPPKAKMGGTPSRFVNVTSLKMAVKEDPQSTLYCIQSLITENAELKTKLAFASERSVYDKWYINQTVRDYEELQSIGKAKQYILWQYIQRLTAGENSPRTSISEPVTCIEVGYEEGLSLQRVHSGQSTRLDPNAVCFLL